MIKNALLNILKVNKPMDESEIRNNKISALAYFLHLQNPLANADENWHKAEKFLFGIDLVDGETYLTRDGNFKIEVTKFGELFIGSNRLAYLNDGHCRTDKNSHDSDLVSLV